MAPVSTLGAKSSLPDLFWTDEVDKAASNPSVFCYAVAGAGKTNMLRTLFEPGEVTKKTLLPASKPPLALATEDGQTKGMGTLNDLHVPAILVDNLIQVDAILAELAANAKPGELWYNGRGPFGALVADSLTGLGPMLENASKAMKGWTSIWGDVSSGSRKDPRTAYPYIAEKGREIVRKMMALPVPLIMTAREQVFTEGEGTNAVSYAAPELPGAKLPKELPGWPEATIRLRVINGVRQFQTETEGNVIARVRLGGNRRLPKYIKPNVGALIRYMQGFDDALQDLELPKR